MKLIAIVDSVGRVILGRHDVESSSDTQTSIKNPAVVNIQVDQKSGQISVQLIPFIFREFIKLEKRESGAVWKFTTANIVTSDDIELEDNIIDQYEKIFENPLPEPEAVDEVQAEPVEVFEDQKE
jgi:hypothetical protein